MIESICTHLSYRTFLFLIFLPFRTISRLTYKIANNDYTSLSSDDLHFLYIILTTYLKDASISCHGKLAVTFFATKFKETYKQSFKSHNDIQLLLCQALRKRFCKSKLQNYFFIIIVNKSYRIIENLVIFRYLYSFYLNVTF